MTVTGIALIFVSIWLLATFVVLNKTIQDYRLHSQWAEEKRLKDVQAYIKVLDVARRFNLDRKAMYSMGGGLMGSFGGAKHRAYEVELNDDLELLHSSFKELARYFDEPDPCPCQRCYVDRATAGMSGSEKLALFRGAQPFR